MKNAGFDEAGSMNVGFVMLQRETTNFDAITTNIGYISPHREKGIISYLPALVCL